LLSGAKPIAGGREKAAPAWGEGRGGAAELPPEGSPQPDGGFVKSGLSETDMASLHLMEGTIGLFVLLCQVTPS
jgi:hypothetical protein